MKVKFNCLKRQGLLSLLQALDDTSYIQHAFVIHDYGILSQINQRYTESIKIQFEIVTTHFVCTVPTT